MIPLVRNLNSLYELLVDTVNRVLEHDGFALAAEAAYYWVFSIFPLLFLVSILISELGLLSRHPGMSANLMETLSGMLPRSSLRVLRAQLSRMQTENPGRNLLLSGVFMLWPASSIFHVFVKSTIRAYGAPNLRSYLKTRFLSLGLVLGSSVFFIGAFVIIVLGPVLIYWLGVIGINLFIIRIFRALRVLAAFSLITPSLALLYYLGPDFSNRRMYSIWPGAFLATLVWLVASYLFSVYLSYFGTYTLLYGALGGGMILILWMYLTSLAVILGAEFNAALDHWRG